MPRYEAGGTAVRRKNLYMPCVIGAKFKEMTVEEQMAVYKATYWADNITNAEWPLVLRDEGVKAYVRSRFKKKAAGWLMALARVAFLHPALFADITVKAEEMYREQIGDTSFELRTLRNIARVAQEVAETETEPGVTTSIHSQVWIEDVPD